MPKRYPSQHRNYDWGLTCTDTNMRDGTWSLEHIKVVTLCDIRAELIKLNSLLHCHNFQGIPATLKGIRRKLPTPVKATRTRRGTGGGT